MPLSLPSPSVAASATQQVWEYLFLESEPGRRAARALLGTAESWGRLTGSQKERLAHAFRPGFGYKAGSTKAKQYVAATKAL
jgi:hypothetical protein